MAYGLTTTTEATTSLEKSQGDFCLKLIKKFYEFFAYGLTATTGLEFHIILIFYYCL